MEWILALIVAPVLLFWYLNKSKAGGSHLSSSESYQRQPKMYRLFSVQLRVNSARGYDRPNVDGSIRFRGTEINGLAIARNQNFDMSLEGLSDIANVGEVIDVVNAPYNILSIRSSLPVFVLNRSRASAHFVDANIEKCAESELGGIDQLRKEIKDFAQYELKTAIN